jgi:hypothetical protein
VAKHGIDMVGPVRLDPRASEHPGFAKEDFDINWEARTATCPQGVTSPPWKPTAADGKPGMSVLFRRSDFRTMAITPVGLVGAVAGLLAVPLGVAVHQRVLPVMADSIGTRLPAAASDVYWPAEVGLLAAAGLVIAVFGAIVPARLVASAHVSRALRAE